MARVLACSAFALGIAAVVGCGGDDGPGPRGDAGPGFDASDEDAGPRPDGASSECRSDEECDDDVYCNGQELCLPGDARADDLGCVLGDAVDCDDGLVCTLDSCSDELRACRHTPPDIDGDGHGDVSCIDSTGAPLGDDCNDSDALAYPGNAEICDGHDDDCNPDTLGFLDADGDGSSSVACCNGTSCGPDCNDADNTIRPGVADGPMMACDGTDNDCDGSADEGCTCPEGSSRPCGSEAELMSIGTCRPGMQFCIGGTRGTCTGNVPPAEEICDGLDNDCDTVADEDVERTYYRDADGDGFGRAGEMTTACSAPTGYSASSTDCDDASAAVNPGAPEVCNDRDDNCNGMMDEGLRRTFYRDADADGFGDAAMTMSACSAPMGYVTSPTDCNDASATVHPAATEVCNGVDDNCDRTADPGCSCTEAMTRPCGSSMTGTCRMGTQRCTGGAWAACIGAVEPVPEACNGADEDCDGTADDGVQLTFYRDADGDGFGVAAMTMRACAQPSGYSTLSTDCDDANGARNPAAFERCNTVDDDCDGMTDEGCACTDGATRACGTSMIGVCRRGTQQCVGGMWPSSCIGNVEPGTESCNGLDDDCDGMTDEMLRVTCYADGDADSYGAGTTSSQCNDPARAGAMFGGCPAGYSFRAMDCVDSSPTIHPGATETCNGLDDDCDTMRDEGLTATCYVDGDGDGDGAMGSMASSRCADSARPAFGNCPVGYTNDATDCNDSNALVRVGATEVCNGADDDCDGMADEGVRITFYRDMDGDGFGCGSCPTMMGCDMPAGHVRSSSDCDDTMASRNPGAPEVCDGVDNDCDRMTDEGAMATRFRDTDGDGFGGGAAVLVCPTTPGYSDVSTDCHDGMASVFPGQSAFFGTPYCPPSHAFDCGTRCCTSPICGMGVACVNKSYDYNCSGLEEREPPMPSACTACNMFSTTPCGVSGYDYTGTPACGSNSVSVTTCGSACSMFTMPCAPFTTTRALACH